MQVLYFDDILGSGGLNREEYLGGVLVVVWGYMMSQGGYQSLGKRKL